MSERVERRRVTLFLLNVTAVHHILFGLGRGRLDYHHIQTAGPLGQIRTSRDAASDTVRLMLKLLMCFFQGELKSFPYGESSYFSLESRRAWDGFGSVLAHIRGSLDSPDMAVTVSGFFPHF